MKDGKRFYVVECRMIDGLVRVFRYKARYPAEAEKQASQRKGVRQVLSSLEDRHVPKAAQP